MDLPLALHGLLFRSGHLLVFSTSGLSRPSVLPGAKSDCLWLFAPRGKGGSQGTGLGQGSGSLGRSPSSRLLGCGGDLLGEPAPLGLVG